MKNKRTHTKVSFKSGHYYYKANLEEILMLLSIAFMSFA